MLPYLLFAVVVSCGVSFGAGWHYGGKIVKAEWANEKIDAAAEKADAEQRIRNADARADREAAARKRDRLQANKAIQEALMQHAQNLPDPPECALDPLRVQNINAALTGSADTRNKAATVSATGTAKERQP